MERTTVDRTACIKDGDVAARIIKDGDVAARMLLRTVPSLIQASCCVWSQ
ncbi:hypothetical protein chiPu_0023465, partial [Chiloscyllium punctatum]|nr:hypothetical protein [Chiloscyllium punctatum]